MSKRNKTAVDLSAVNDVKTSKTKIKRSDKGGRPTKDREKITLYFEKPIKDKLRDFAHYSKQSQSDVVNQAVKEYLKRTKVNDVKTS